MDLSGDRLKFLKSLSQDPVENSGSRDRTYTWVRHFKVEVLKGALQNSVPKLRNRSKFSGNEIGFFNPNLENLG